MSRELRTQLDDTLIDLLQQNPRASYQDMAELAGASASTVARRVTRLIDTGAIALTAVPCIRPEDEQQTVLLGVAVDIGMLRPVAEALAAMSATRWVGMVSGTHPLLVRVTLPPSERVVDFIMQKVATIPKVRDVQTITVLETIKALDMRPPSEIGHGPEPTELMQPTGQRLAGD